MDVFNCTLIANTKITETACDMRILSDIAAAAKPGQFVHIKCEGFTLRRPISICDTDGDTLRIVVDRRGRGTEWLASRPKFSSLDLLGPLGNGFDTSGSVLVVGGGVGCPPLLYASKSADSADAILGFRNSAASMLLGDFRDVCGTVQIATDDGSLGFHGKVDELLRRRLSEYRYDRVLACGPTPMLKACKKVCKEFDTPLEVSLEERMGCGVGACLVCAVRLRGEQGEYVGHVCKDGPVFDAEEVCFDD